LTTTVSGRDSDSWGRLRRSNKASRSAGSSEGRPRTSPLRPKPRPPPPGSSDGPGRPGRRTSSVWARTGALGSTSRASTGSPTDSRVRSRPGRSLRSVRLRTSEEDLRPRSPRPSRRPESDRGPASPRPRSRPGRRSRILSRGRSAEADRASRDARSGSLSSRTVEGALSKTPERAAKAAPRNPSTKRNSMRWKTAKVTMEETTR
jgi:hypothetical protein